LLRAAEDLLSRRTSGQVAWGGPDLLDQSRMSSLFRKALAPVASTPHQVSVATADLIASAAGRRRVVQYTIEGLEGEQPVTLVAKASTEPQRARLLYQHLRVLSNGPFARGRLRVPQPVAFLPEHHLVLYRPAEGVPLSELDDWPLAVEATREAARWLARLHTSGLNLPRTLDLGREARSTHQWADMIGSYRRTLFRPAHRLASRWAMAARAAPSRGCVPIHKDFHAGHVVVGSDVCVIDLDEARNGNPALDVAHFCTYLEHQTDRAETLRDAFLEEYKSATGWEDDESFASFSAYTWLKIAKQLTLRSGPCRGGESGQGISVEEALNRGLACLDR
jgi:Phosphotransferase enzyme family